MIPEERVLPILAIQSKGFIWEDDGCPGSKERIKAACHYIRNKTIPEDAIAVWPQGFNRSNPAYEERGKVSLGKTMAGYASRMQLMENVRHVVKPMSWSTINDIEASIKIAKNLAREPELKCDTVHFYFVSDACHLFRVWLIWSVLHPKGWTASFHKTPKPTLNFFERWILESLKWGKDIILLIYKRIKMIEIAF